MSNKRITYQAKIIGDILCIKIKNVEHLDSFEEYRKPITFENIPYLVI